MFIYDEKDKNKSKSYSQFTLYIEFCTAGFIFLIKLSLFKRNFRLRTILFYSKSLT